MVYVGSILQMIGVGSFPEWGIVAVLQAAPDCSGNPRGGPVGHKLCTEVSPSLLISLKKP